MIHLSNNVSSERIPETGWVVNIRRNSETNIYEVTTKNSEPNVRLLIDPKDYFELTTQFGIDQRALSKLVSIQIGDMLIPMLKKVDYAEDDVNTILFYIELDIGESIIDINLTNLAAVSYSIGEIDNKQYLALICSAIDSNSTSKINIEYGYIGGRSLSSKTFSYSSMQEKIKNRSIGINIDSNITSIDKIEVMPYDINIIDLNSILIN